MFDDKKMKVALWILGTSFIVLLLGMIMIFGSFGAIGIGMGIPTVLISLAGSIFGAVSAALLCMDWFSE